MLNVGLILKTISTEVPAETPTAAFLNWLSYSCQSDELVTPELVNSFFQECLDYPHWQQNKRNLGEEIRHLLESTCLHLDEVFEFADIVWPTQMQVIELEILPDWVDTVNSYLTLQHKGGAQFRIVHDEVLQRLIAVVLHPSGGLTLREFNRKFFVRNGALTPLREDLQIHFNARLELQKDQPQKVGLGNFITARFVYNGSSLFGALARGYSFNKYQSLDGLDLLSHPKLFYTLKRLEQHFVKRDSDPFYNELVANIEHTIRMLRIGDEEFIGRAPDMLSQAQNALDYVFVSDKLLSLLIRDLQHTMAGQKRSDLTTGVTTTAVRQKDEFSRVANRAPQALLKQSGFEASQVQPGLRESVRSGFNGVEASFNDNNPDSMDLIDLGQPYNNRTSYPDHKSRVAPPVAEFARDARPNAIRPHATREEKRDEDAWSQQSLIPQAKKSRWPDLTN